MVGIEHFLNALPREKAIWVSERKPKTCRAAGELADENVQAREREPGMRSAGLNTPTGNWCDKCRRGGHVKEECWSKENSNTQGSTGNFREKKIRCYNCREEGHTRKICPKRKSGVIL